MNFIKENSIQGWNCPICGYNLITTYIDEIYEDTEEYSIFLKKPSQIDVVKIKTISIVAGVNYIEARTMLSKSNICVFKGKAPQVKATCEKLKKAEILFDIIPKFKY